MDVLKNKSYKTYDYFCRYSSFPYYFNTEDNKYVYGTTAQLSTDTPYVMHIVKKGETLDSLALDAYNNPTYFFLIADFNRIQNPYEPLEVGSQIKIPTFSSVTYEAQ
ncbi:MAG: LysM peptidoglycan-binding domain-containing protein [Romboutsia timonensis]